jgi:hypothetical protein
MVKGKDRRGNDRLALVSDAVRDAGPKMPSIVREDVNVRNQGLFPCEKEIARRLSQEPTKWHATAAILERHGLPRVDPLMCGRYWPAVLAWWNRRYGLAKIEPSQPDGEEDLNAL